MCINQAQEEEATALAVADAALRASREAGTAALERMLQNDNRRESQKEASVREVGNDKAATPMESETVKRDVTAEKTEETFGHATPNQDQENSAPPVVAESTVANDVVDAVSDESSSGGAEKKSVIDERIKVRVTIQGRRSLMVKQGKVAANETVRALCWRLSLPSTTQLVYQGEPLDPDRTVLSYGIQSGDEISTRSAPVSRHNKAGPSKPFRRGSSSHTTVGSNSTSEYDSSARASASSASKSTAFSQSVSASRDASSSVSQRYSVSKSRRASSESPAHDVIIGNLKDHGDDSP